MMEGSKRPCPEGTVSRRRGEIMISESCGRRSEVGGAPCLSTRGRSLQREKKWEGEKENRRPQVKAPVARGVKATKPERVQSQHERRLRRFARRVRQLVEWKGDWSDNSPLWT